jgi:hypothetical protein
MINLAGRSDADVYIRKELTHCRIPVIPYNGKGEVPATIQGKLGDFTFHRAWYYFIVEGPTPLEVARELYADPLGRDDVRVNGHGNGLNPDEWGTSYYAPDGRKIIPTTELTKFEAVAKDCPTIKMDEIHKKFIFSDNKSNAKGIVDSYHIDSKHKVVSL